MTNNLVCVGWALFKNGLVRTGGWKETAKIYKSKAIALAAAKRSDEPNAVARQVWVVTTMETTDE